MVSRLVPIIILTVFAFHAHHTYADDCFSSASENDCVPESPLVKEALEHAKQLVSFAYNHSRKRRKAVLAKGSLSASDLLSLFKHPEAETNVAIQAAELMDTTVELIRQLVYTREKRYGNMTGVLSGHDLSILAKVTGCAAQLRPITCSDTCLTDKYRSIDGTCNNRYIWPSS
ncbi:hypothetical protein lerEdw1_012985 [Lerista edwardsae]|nr:hypothetical protein lerEdw1_012985 [Lerista edwardsae]